jgi:hypothetical protein
LRENVYIDLLEAAFTTLISRSSSLPESSSYFHGVIPALIVDGAVDPSTPTSRLMAVAGGSGIELLGSTTGITPTAFMRVARAGGLLHRVAFNLSTSGQLLTIDSPTMHESFFVPQRRAIVYMDQGTYTVRSNLPGTHPAIIVVAADLDLPVLF